MLKKVLCLTAMVAGLNAGLVWADTYEGDGYSFEYPSGWDVVEGEGVAAVTVYSPDKKAFYEVVLANESDYSGMSALDLLGQIIDGMKGTPLYDAQEYNSAALNKINAEDGAMCAIENTLKIKGKKTPFIIGISVMCKSGRIFVAYQYITKSSLSKYKNTMGKVANSFVLTQPSDYSDDESSDDDSSDYESSGDYESSDDDDSYGDYEY